MNHLTIYCPNHQPLVKRLTDQGYSKYMVCFEPNPFFKKFNKRVINYLKRLKRGKLIDECLKFWFLYLLKQSPCNWISDYNYYGTLVKFFGEQNIFRYDPMFRPIKLKKRYVVIVYKNNKFFFIETFTSLSEMEHFFQIRIKIEKRDYRIKLK